MPTATTITIEETLDLLDGPLNSFSQGFQTGLYALWLGSGISRERVVGLDGVIAKLLENLRLRITGVGCDHHQAFERILNLAELSDADKAQIDIGQPVASWPVHNELINAYSPPATVCRTASASSAGIVIVILSMAPIATPPRDTLDHTYDDTPKAEEREVKAARWPLLSTSGSIFPAISVLCGRKPRCEQSRRGCGNHTRSPDSFRHSARTFRLGIELGLLSTRQPHHLQNQDGTEQLHGLFAAARRAVSPI